MPEGAGRVALRPDRRREIYLLLKEALVNAARHSGARHLTLRARTARRRLAFELTDDGRGFDRSGLAPERLVGGHGLRNMESRASGLGGTLRIESAPGRGTTLRLEVPESG